MRKSTTTRPGDSSLDMQVTIQAPKPLGLTAKVYIQEKARNLSLYNKAIKSTGSGQDKEGNKIAINTVGRWLFGVPGYSGHIRVVAEDDKVLVFFPKESSKVVHELVSSLKEAVETNQ